MTTGMNLLEFAQLLIAIAAIGSLIASVRNSGAIDKARQGIEKVHLSTNSKMDELIRVVRKAAHASGYKDGLAASQAQRQAAAGQPKRKKRNPPKRQLSAPREGRPAERKGRQPF